ncbi:hypothetical protein B5G06_03260 [Flavonifractor sp. An52]|nr:hypothetical protein B5G06_03260 [Flavonifractor sp. An52]
MAGYHGNAEGMVHDALGKANLVGGLFSVVGGGGTGFTAAAGGAGAGGETKCQGQCQNESSNLFHNFSFPYVH